jgi:CubicO group peptidase (beta-lactamase class C family)
MDERFLGEWYGLLEAGPQRFRLQFVLNADGSGTVYSLDQGAIALEAGVEIAGTGITVTVPAVQGRFLGQLEAGRLVGNWNQGATLPVTFQRDAIPAPTPPEPAVPPRALTQADLAALRAQSHAPAMTAAAASRDGRRVSFVDGRRSALVDTPATTQDRWHLGSCTKSMTATLVALAAEAGAVSWDDTVGAVLGAAVPDVRAEYRDVTFRHLLSHRAGLQANIPLDSLIAFSRENADPRADRIAYARLALAQTPHAPKEQAYLYSNDGYVLAGAMLEARLGATWESLIRERLFAPLGMQGAGFGAPGVAGRLDEPVGHSAGNAIAPGAPSTDNPAVLGPAGRVHARCDDVLAYLAAHRDRSALLRPESWALLHTPPFGGDYAMGWMVTEHGIWHNGSNTLWYAEMAFNPATGAVAFAAVNSGDLQTVIVPTNAALRNAALAVT